MPKTNWKQREAFVNCLINSALLDEAVEWIGEELDPETVFSQKKLEQWAFDNGFRKFE